MPREGKQTALVRKDGLVPVSEIVRATGWSHAEIIRRLDAGEVPGKRMGWRWYVDVRGLIHLGLFPKDSTIGKALASVASTVGRNAPTPS